MVFLYTDGLNSKELSNFVIICVIFKNLAGFFSSL